MNKELREKISKYNSSSLLSLPAPPLDESSITPHQPMNKPAKSPSREHRVFKKEKNNDMRDLNKAYDNIDLNIIKSSISL